MKKLDSTLHTWTTPTWVIYLLVISFVLYRSIITVIMTLTIRQITIIMADPSLSRLF
jgi:hypothetical protein